MYGNWINEVFMVLLLTHKLYGFYVLRIACRDDHHEYSSFYLAKRCNHANPDEWSQYSSASIVIKTLRDKHPNRC